MKYKEIIKGYSIFNLLNLILLQWLFFRVVAQINPVTSEITKIGLIYPVVPLTGIWTRYLPKKIYRTWIYKLKH